MSTAPGFNEDQQKKFRSDLALAIRTQNNQATANPIFVIERRERVWGMIEDFADGSAWVNIDDEGEQATEKMAAALEEAHEGGELIWSGWGKMHYRDIWVFVTACFTRDGCDLFLRSDGRNQGVTRIYVHGAYRNHEWIKLRYLLSGGAVTE